MIVADRSAGQSLFMNRAFVVSTNTVGAQATDRRSGQRLSRERLVRPAHSAYTDVIIVARSAVLCGTARLMAGRALFDAHVDKLIAQEFTSGSGPLLTSRKLGCVLCVFSIDGL